MYLARTNWLVRTHLVSERADGRAERARKTEVRQLQLAVSAHQEILRLEVAGGRRSQTAAIGRGQEAGVHLIRGNRVKRSCHGREAACEQDHEWNEPHVVLECRRVQGNICIYCTGPLS